MDGRSFARSLRLFTRDLRSYFVRSDLTRLARLHKTDKWGAHRYTTHYQAMFEARRRRRMVVLEIGIGGYKDPHAGGASLRMWKHFFPRSLIAGIDLHEKILPSDRRIKIFRGSQVDEPFLRRVIDELGGVDIVIDDGSHRNEHVIETFRILFPLLRDGGIYAVEDTQTSYWPSMGGDSADFSNPATMMAFFKGLADGLNHAEWLRPGHQPGYNDMHVAGLHFFHNLVFVEKGDNGTPSNMVREGRLKEGVTRGLDSQGA
jgi:hypothetical protein